MSTAEFVVVGAHAWGRAATQEAAKQEFRRAGGRLARGYIVWYFDGVNSRFDSVDRVDGSLCYEGERPVEIARRAPQKT